MNSLQIQYFLTTAERESFTEAARQLFVSQPAVSKQIRLLEEELGCELFKRSGKNAVLTYEGQQFMAYFSQCRFQMDLLKSRLAEKKESGFFPMSVSYLEGLDPGNFLPAMERAAERTSPLLRLKTACYGLPQLLKSLYDGGSDAVLTFGSPLSHEPCHAEPLVEIPRVLLYSAARFGNGPGELSWFREEPFLLPEDEYTSNLEQTLYGMFLKLGFTPKIEYVPNFSTIMDCVEQGKGVFVYNRWCRQCRMPEFGFLPLPSSQTLYLVRKEEEAGEMDMRFFHEIRREFGQIV